VLTVDGGWQNVFTGKAKLALEAALPGYLKLQRWCAGRNRNIRAVSIREIVPFNDVREALVFLQVDYSEGDLDYYTLPLAFATGTEAEQLQSERPHLAVAELRAPGGERSGILFEATGRPAFWQRLLELVVNRHRFKGSHGEVEATRTPALRRILGNNPAPEPALLKAEQNHTTVLYGDKVALKLFRQVHAGVNPELEMDQFLAGRNFPQIASPAGAWEYVAKDGTCGTLAIVSALIPQAKTALDYTLDALGRFYERITTLDTQAASNLPPMPNPTKLLEKDIAPAVLELLGTYAESARLLGQRTAELHLALASELDDKKFAPESFGVFYQRSLLQSMRNLAVENLWQLRRQSKTLPSHIQRLAQRVVELRPVIIDRFRQLFEHRLAAQRIRIHGNFQLGQVLWTGKDYVFLGFEGDVAIPISERVIKQSPLRDVASMVRAFHYAASAGLYQHVERGNVQLPVFEKWAHFWSEGVSAVFLKAYFQRLGKSGLLPEGETELNSMLQAYLLNQMFGEIDRQLHTRPDNLNVPLEDILRLLGQPLPARSEAVVNPVAPDDAKQMPQPKNPTA
jgi:maltose alpha-D-glucosyltransferase/alpha-amylase